MTVKYAAPDDVADALTVRHALDCDDCDVEDERLCRYHLGFREGTLLLLLKASME